MEKEQELTLAHALYKKGKPELKEMLKGADDLERIDPNTKKADLVKDLATKLTESQKSEVISSTFIKPKALLTVQLGNREEKLNLSKEEIEKLFKEYNEKSVFNEYEFEKSKKDEVYLESYSDDTITIYYVNIIRQPQFNYETLESSLYVTQNRIKIVLNNLSNRVIVYTGNQEYFNDALTALTISLKSIFKPLNINKTGITNDLKGSFTFHTVKVIDFIYNGIEKLGNISSVHQVHLESMTKGTKSQKVKVQGNKLLDDKVISEYLFLHSRNLVGLKCTINLNINDVSTPINCDFNFKDNRLKIGIRKDKYTIDELNSFLNLIEEIFYKYIAVPGVIDHSKAVKKLNEIKETALGAN